jgi:hypothetical protein
MSQVIAETEEQVEPVGQVRIVYLGPVEPHWDFQPVWGDEAELEAFADRVAARLLLLPPHDPQFRRNRERVNRDGEREAILVEWDLGYPEEPPAVPAEG